MKEAPFQARKVEHGTILIDGEYQPLLMELLMRPSTSSPTRVKAVLGARVQFDGEEAVVPMPFASAQYGRGMAVEFRLEQN